MYELSAYAELAAYKRTVGLTFDKLKDPGNGMMTVWIILASEWLAMMLLVLGAERVSLPLHPWGSSWAIYHPPFLTGEALQWHGTGRLNGPKMVAHVTRRDEVKCELGST